jgi:hypothetical protein
MTSKPILSCVRLHAKGKRRILWYYISLYVVVIVNKLRSYHSLYSDSLTKSTFTLVQILYRVSQGERSIFWEVIVSVILSKKM